jgi:hypothetical protein
VQEACTPLVKKIGGLMHICYVSLPYSREARLLSYAKKQNLKQTSFSEKGIIYRERATFTAFVNFNRICWESEKEKYTYMIMHILKHLEG